MRLSKTYGWAAAGVAAAAMVAAPLPAMAEETTDASTGDLTITRFDDRYADGLYDPSKVAPSGESDQLRTGVAQLVDVNGTRHYISSGADSLYHFEDVPVGPATLYLGYPNTPPRELLFDATGATSPADLIRLDTREYYGPQGALDLVITEGDQSRLIGMTALSVNAKVSYADGSVAGGLTSIEFGSNGDWFAGSEYAGLPGGYAALEGYSELRHLPGELGMRITAPEGYQVASVQAFTGSAPLSYPDIPMTLTERDGAYWVDSLDVPRYFFGAAFHVTLEEVPDTVRPETTLVSPTTAGPFQQLSLQVDATDDVGLKRIVANIYQDGTLVESTQSAVADGATSGSHVATVALADGDYTIKYNSQDLAGNISQTRTFAFTIDATAPTVTVKEGAPFTVYHGGEVSDSYNKVSFKLHDAGKIDRVELNGVVKDLTDNAWSDVNFVKPGTFGAVRGENTLVVYDVAGNATTLTFTLK